MSGRVWLASLISRLRAAADAACLLLVGAWWGGGGGWGGGCMHARRQAGNQVCSASFDACTAAPPLTKSDQIMQPQAESQSEENSAQFLCTVTESVRGFVTPVASTCD